MRSTKGLTLIEVLLATAIIGLAVGILSYTVNAFRMNIRAERETGGLNVARSFADSVRGVWQNQNLYDFASLPDFQIPPLYTLNIRISEKYGPNSTTVTGNFDISCINSTNINKLLSTCVTLTAATNLKTDFSSRTRSLTVTAVDTARNAGSGTISTWISRPLLQ